MAGDDENPRGNQQVICEQLRAPSPLECTKENFPKVWKDWKIELELYMDLAHSTKQNDYKIKMLKYLIGRTGHEIYNTLDFENVEENRTLDEVIKAFDKRADPKKNEIVERYRFFTREQKKGESIESYQTELKLLQTYKFWRPRKFLNPGQDCMWD